LIADGGNLLQALAATDVSKDLSAADRAIRVRLTAELNAQPWASMLAKNVVVANGSFTCSALDVATKSAEPCVPAESVPGVVPDEDRMMRRQATIGE